MTQVTGGASFRAAAVDIGTTSACTTSLDSAATAVRVTGGTRETGEANTFDGDIPIVAAGKRSGFDIEVRFVYTETSTEAFTLALAIYEATGGPCFLRFSPLGDAVGTNFRFETSDDGAGPDAGVMTEFLYPSGEAEGGAIIPGGFTVHCAALYKTTSA